MPRFREAGEPNLIADQRRERLYSHGNGIIVEVKARVMEARHVGFLCWKQAQGEEAGWDLLAVEGEILASHDWGHGFDPLLTERRCSDPLPAVIGLGGVEGNGIAIMEGDFGRTAMGCGDAFEDLPEGSVDGLSGLWMKESGCALQINRFRDDIMGRSAFNTRDRQDAALHGINLAGDDLLSRLNHRRCSGDWVDAQVWHRGVASASGDSSLEAIGGGENRSGTRCDLSKPQGWPSMQSIDRLHGRAEYRTIEASILHHPFATGTALFSGLKNQRDRAGQRSLLRQCRQHAGDTNQNARVPVVAAGMHPPLGLRGIREPGLFENRQRIHVGAERDRLAFAAGKVAQHARSSGQPRLELDAGRGELTLDDFTCAVFFIPQFRVGVQIMSDVDKVAQMRFDDGMYVRHFGDGT